MCASLFPAPQQHSRLRPAALADKNQLGMFPENTEGQIEVLFLVPRLRVRGSTQGMGAIAPQQIAAMAQQQQLQNLTQQLESQLSLQNMNLNFFNQVSFRWSFF